jgi:hypothetical protein
MRNKMSKGIAAFSIIMLLVASTICFCLRKGCVYEGHCRADFIKNGYEFRQVPYSYGAEWVKPENKEK